jgi:hypothetical protein
MGGQTAAWFGIRYVFFITSALLLLNAVWVYFKVYRNLDIQQTGENEDSGIIILQPDEMDETNL